MTGENPCNVCKRNDKCLDISCALMAGWASGITCSNYECMLHVEDQCMLGLEPECGANPNATFDEEEEDEEEGF